MLYKESASIRIAQGVVGLQRARSRPLLCFLALSSSSKSKKALGIKDGIAKLPKRDWNTVISKAPCGSHCDYWTGCILCGFGP